MTASSRSVAYPAYLGHDWRDLPADVEELRHEPQDDWARFSRRLAFIWDDRYDLPCCVCMGSCDQKGYAHFLYRRQSRRAHTVSWEWANGPIPPGMQIHHRCERKNCVSIQHLQLVTAAEHSGLHRAPTCKHGHERTPENTYLHAHKDGYVRKVCIPCQRQWHRENGARLAARRKERERGQAHDRGTGDGVTLPRL